MSFKKTITPSQAKEKILKFCAYQERSHAEVKRKLIALGLPFEDCDEVLLFLIKSNYLNEERFSKAFSGGKFRTKGWGKNKLRQELKQKGLSDRLIEKSLQSEINNEEYEQRLAQLLLKKNNLLKEPNLLLRKKKLISFAFQKGYETELVIKKVNDLFESGKSR